MRAQGMTIRAVAAALGVSHPTVLRDLRAHDQAEAGQVAAVRVIAAEPDRDVLWRPQDDKAFRPGDRGAPGHVAGEDEGQSERDAGYLRGTCVPSG